MLFRQIDSPKQKKQKLIKFLISFCLVYSYLFFYPLGFSQSEKHYSYALYDRNNVLTGASVADDGQWRFAPGKVPYKFEKAIITFEDKRYYRHHGIDFISISFC